MKTRLLSLVTLALGGAFAVASPVDTLSAEAAHRIPVDVPARAATCPDLSGTWEGTCAVGGATSPKETMVVTQNGCDSLQMGKENITIGALETRSVSAPGAHATATAFALAYGWSKDGKALEIHYQGLSKVLDASEAYPLSGVGVTRVDNGRLVTALNVLGANVSCQYDRK